MYSFNSVTQLYGVSESSVNQLFRALKHTRVLLIKRGQSVQTVGLETETVHEYQRETTE